MKHIITAIIISLTLTGCSTLGFGKKAPIAKAYPQVKLTTTEDAVTHKVTDRIVYTDRTLTKAIFQERIDRFVNDGGWTVIIPAYLNSLQSEVDFGIYIATLERVRPQ